jgi:hypothetical protein
LSDVTLFEKVIKKFQNCNYEEGKSGVKQRETKHFCETVWIEDGRGKSGEIGETVNEKLEVTAAGRKLLGILGLNCCGDGFAKGRDGATVIGKSG